MPSPEFKWEQTTSPELTSIDAAAGPPGHVQELYILKYINKEPLVHGLAGLRV